LGFCRDLSSDLLLCDELQAVSADVISWYRYSCWPSRKVSPLPFASFCPVRYRYLPEGRVLCGGGV
jgi:hypothetical protein